MHIVSPFDPDDQADRLGVFLRWLSAVAAFFGVLELAASVAFSDPQSRGAGILILGYFVVTLVAMYLTDRGKVVRAALLTAIGILVTAVLISLVQPVVYPGLVVVTLISIAVALPYLRGRTLTVSLSAAWFAAIVIVSVGTTRPSPSVLPEAFLAILNISAVAATVGLALVLLWQFGSRLTTALEATEHAMRDLHHAEAERREAERRLLERERQESLGALAGGVAHDFNNLLTTIIGYAELLKSDPTRGVDDDEALDQIDVAARRAAALCRQMLAYAGRGAVALRPMDVEAFLVALEPDVRATVPDAITLEMTRQRDLPPLLRGDADQLRQAILDIVTNAVEAILAHGGRGTVGVHATLATVDGTTALATISPDPIAAGRYVAIAVTDSGPGVDPSIHGRVFEPFFSTRFIGRGMGLPVALGIARGHRGVVTIEAPAGGGATVRLLIPVADASEAASDPPAV